MRGSIMLPDNVLNVENIEDEVIIANEDFAHSVTNPQLPLIDDSHYLDDSIWDLDNLSHDTITYQNNLLGTNNNNNVGVAETVTPSVLEPIDQSELIAEIKRLKKENNRLKNFVSTPNSRSYSAMVHEIAALKVQNANLIKEYDLQAEKLKEKDQEIARLEAIINPPKKRKDSTYEQTFVTGRPLLFPTLFPPVPKEQLVNKAVDAVKFNPVAPMPATEFLKTRQPK